MKYYEENSAAMSEDENLDVESDEEESSDNKSRNANNQYFSQAEKRAHHNALERKRRDHIKDSFTSLRDSVPSLQGEKASRAQILKKAAEYIQFMRRKNNSHQQDIDDLKRQNSMLEAQIRSLERARQTGNFGGGESGNEVAMESVKSDVSSHESSDENDENERRNKRFKTTTY
ncbi:hypothetical protein PVAND_008671 [Polypedilum vanderplanki]|uniref:Protein max n=1 Tax=Polypedilum vanderplanki TaxID=319348 RepID=A0A9J6CAI4_POLVA|nr:hypothetical protein PVAND_008671 [Polypedilum vanderplanki]